MVVELDRGEFKRIGDSNKNATEQGGMETRKKKKWKDTSKNVEIILHTVTNVFYNK